MKRVPLVLAACVLVLVIAVAAAAALGSEVKLTDDPVALARVSVGPFGGTVVHVTAVDAKGRAVPLATADGRVTPLAKLAPGEVVTVHITVRRPGWLGWALGSYRTERLTLRTPTAQVTDRWSTLATDGRLHVNFDEPVAAVAFGAPGKLGSRLLSSPQRSVTISPGTQQTGTIEVAAAPRRWERLGSATLVSWFPRSSSTVMVSLPANGASIAPATQIHLTFSKPVEQVLGSRRPRLTPSIPGSWRQSDSHSLTFTPTGLGAPLDSPLTVQLPTNVAVPVAGALQSSSQIHYTVAPGSLLRLQQLLAQAGFLPVEWHPDGAPVAATAGAQAQAAVEPPAGQFSWRYPNTPRQLQALWTAGRENIVTRGAIMRLENVSGLTVDGLAGALVWHTLLSDAIAGRRQENGYSYVYVHREVPEVMTLWHDGRTVLSSPANTGIPGAETETTIGTFPVFEHIPEGTMTGTNPDGSRYDDPGIKWISYFNKGEALHNFDRTSFGTPQSLGCVELPLAASAEVWPYTPIGTLVTIES